MPSEKPKTVHRADYLPSDYRIETADLAFDLRDDATTVSARLTVVRREQLTGDPPPLVLDGEDLALRSVAIDGSELRPSEYSVDSESLTIANVPARFVLETVVVIEPEKNTSLSGLYKSSGNYCTQCEAMGFRHITYFLDRPDVMATFTTSIEADATAYPVLLSNGNRIEAATLDDGRHRVKWDDPHPKPSYLFALVAGDLRCHAGSFTTSSGREVRLEIWVEPQNIERCEHALVSLQKAMRWDEEVFGLEYDLDIYMIVAVNDFNMGAMENKGLNVFNSKYVLALPETATDDDYEGIEAVIAHEYFHNWTGNRVTCRDWFQLTLKEGLTVLRDQLFTADMTSDAVKRIQDVRMLRTAQFPEDAGPMAHPIRPESYISMDNFYTVTVYEKGAEVVRMYRTLLGEDGFRRGMDLYFERHDGQAVECDDFRAAMADANGFDLAQFERWYDQAGTPEVHATGHYDSASAHFDLTLRQAAQAEEGSETGEDSGAEVSKPWHIPLAMGLLAPDGRSFALRLEGEDVAEPGETRVLELREREHTFRFVDIPEPPIASLFRGFSAPVKLRFERDRDELAFLMANDPDPFNRWDAGQELAKALLLELSTAAEAGEPLELAPLFVDSCGAILSDESLDGSLKSLALTLPGEKLLGQEQAVVEVDGLHAARKFARETIAKAHRAAFEAIYQEGAAAGAYANDGASIDRRRLKNTALAYLMASGDPSVIDRVVEQFESADNMTDRQAALSLLIDCDGPERDRALAGFYERWKDDPLVLDKWFSVQALSTLPNTVERVLELSKHPDFNTANPNRVRSLVAVFGSANQLHFHRADGAGYRFLGDTVLDVDSRNPQLAARLVSLFNPWRRFDELRQQRMREQLERIRSIPERSKDVFEIVERALA